MLYDCTRARTGSSSWSASSCNVRALDVGFINAVDVPSAARQGAAREPEGAALLHDHACTPAQLMYDGQRGQRVDQVKLALLIDIGQTQS
jgi:hypothetical protein